MDRHLVDIIGEETSSSDSSDDEWTAKWVVRPTKLQAQVTQVLDAIPSRKFTPETFMITLVDVINHISVEDGEQAETIVNEAMAELAKRSNEPIVTIIVRRLLPSVLEFIHCMATSK